MEHLILGILLSWGLFLETSNFLQVLSELVVLDFLGSSNVFSYGGFVLQRGVAVSCAFVGEQGVLLELTIDFETARGGHGGGIGDA